jgi:methylthioribose-1-phosphate isomerase
MASACRMAQSSLIIRKIDRNGISAREAAQLLARAAEAIRSVDINESKILAQKAVHIFPAMKNVLKICE